MRARPFFSYYGAKWTLAPKYPRPLGDHIVEPFAGSAQYATFHHKRRVTLVEANPILAGVWRWLIAADAREVLSMPLIEPEQSVDDLNLCQEAKWFVGFWLNTATTTPAKSMSKWMRDYRQLQPGCVWSSYIRQRTAEQIHICNHWEIIEGDYSRAPVQAGDCVFIDPPYIGKKGGYYPNGSASLDYDRLAEWCLDLNAQVIVCEGAGAKWLPFEPFAEARSAQNRSGKTSSEVVWLKGCPKQTSLMDLI
jgi:site-specific DNA-adenine methylase